MWRSVVLSAVSATIWLGSAQPLRAQAEPLLFTDNAALEVPAQRAEVAPKLRLPPRMSVEPASTKPRGITPTASLWGTITAVAVVFVGLALLTRVLRRHGPAGLRTLPNEAVEPLGQRQLARGVTLHLVRCGSRVLLVGVGPDGARTLTEITEPIEVDLLTGACRRDESNGRSFVRMFQREQTTNPVPPESPPIHTRSSGRGSRSAFTEVDGV